MYRYWYKKVGTGRYLGSLDHNLLKKILYTGSCKFQIAEQEILLKPTGTVRYLSIFFRRFLPDKDPVRNLVC